MAVGRTHWVWIAVLFGGLLLIPAAPAHAGDAEVVPAPRQVYGHSHPHGSRFHCPPPCDVHHGHDHHYDYVGGCHGGHYGHGTSWRTIRYHLTGKERVRRMYLQHYFLRRYPFRQGHTRRFSQLTPERRAGINRHGVVRVDDVRRATDLQRAGINRHGVVFLNAIGKVAEDAPRPDAIDYLNRGMARFHFGLYKEAAVDFDTVLSGDDAQAKAPARYGRMLCSVIAGKWRRVAADLGTMARAGELRADDRLLVNEVFRKAESFPSILEGLKGSVRYQGGDAASLVAAWAYIASGRADEAAPYLRRVRRQMPNHPAVAVFEQASGVAPRPAKSQPPAPKTVPTMEPVRPTVPAMRPDSPFQAPLADSKTG